MIPLAIFAAGVLSMFSATFFFAAAEVPDGFAVWSEGNHESRELKYVKLEKGKGAIGSSKKTVCKRGSYADIEGVISFDGKFVAFARQIEHYDDPKCCTDNPGDYHGFGNYDVYIVRIDGDLPATPKKVGHGYFPSWGDDSDGKTKTLYYSWCLDNRGPAIKIMKAIIQSDESVSSPKTHLQNFGESNDPHMQCSPDGKKVAYRGTSGGSGIRIYDSETNWTSSNLGGCHPSWGRNSYWCMWARNNKGAYNNKKVYSAGAAGLDNNHYHIGSSQDMKWVIARIGYNENDQNTAYPIYVYPLIASAKGESAKWSINKSKGTQIGKGTWCDLHVADATESSRRNGCRSRADIRAADIRRIGTSQYLIAVPYAHRVQIADMKGAVIKTFSAKGPAIHEWNVLQNAGVYAIHIIGEATRHAASVAVGR